MSIPYRINYGTSDLPSAYKDKPALLYEFDYCEKYRIISILIREFDNNE